jgi:DNA-directed RNA polymerase III subunit RPC3
VYRALLRVLEGKQRARDDVIQPTEASDDEKDDHPIISTVEIADTLDSSINLDIFVAANDSRMTNGTEKAKQKTTQSAEDAENDAALGIVKREPLDSDDDHAATGFYSHRDRGLRLELIEEHLKLLDEHQLKFCERVGPAGRGEWRVDFTPLIDTLIQRNIDATIMSRLGPVHMRVVRMLRDKGRIDEKQIAAASMMRLKDVRSFLTQLQYAGFVESQDVPKDNQRQPSRTIFLYFYDRQRVQDQLLQRTYKSLSRMFQRLQLERQRYASAIEKAEKMDANQEALNQNEREAVMQWRAVEEKLLLQVDRLDSQVALLRDFSGRNVSLLS